MRAIRTEDYLYIVNFKTEREPMGDLLKLTEKKPPTFDQLNNNTRVTYADVDAGPTKAFFVKNRNNPKYQLHWNLGFGPRTSEELYDLKSDPHQMKNLASTPELEATRSKLRAQLFTELTKHNDPRLDGDQFDYPPYCKIGLPKED